MDDARKEEARERARGRLYEKILQLQDELDQLRVELPAMQAREVKLLADVQEAAKWSPEGCHSRYLLHRAINTHTHDDTILREMIEAARQEERESIIAAMPGGCSVDPQWVCDMTRARGG